MLDGKSVCVFIPGLCLYTEEMKKNCQNIQKYVISRPGPWTYHVCANEDEEFWG